MKKKDILILPSNKNFGYFFTIIFFGLSVYFYFKEINIAFYISGVFFLILFLITSFKADILRPFNKLWMNFGLFLGMIVSPIVIGVIFFFIFTPIGIFMRLFGRDELLLKIKNKPSYWIKRDDDIHPNSFKNQF